MSITSSFFPDVAECPRNGLISGLVFLCAILPKASISFQYDTFGSFVVLFPYKTVQWSRGTHSNERGQGEFLLCEADTRRGAWFSADGSSLSAGVLYGSSMS